MGTRQTRIFVRSDEPDDWAETLVGRVLRPLTAEFSDSLNWFWFSRYGQPADESGDCDIVQISAEYKVGGMHRSLRFRYDVADDQQTAFETRALELINGNAYRVSD